MAFNNNTLPNLSRFSIGEIVDLSGVPSFYNAGSSTWLRSGASTASSTLSTTTKTNLAAAGTATAQTVLAQSTLSLSYNNSGYYVTYPIERISASSISVVPAAYTFTTDVGVGVITSAGMQTVGTGQTSIRSAVSGGSNAMVASNNTKIFSYCFSAANTLSVKSTTNGTTWTTETVTGLPTSPIFTVANTTQAHASNSTGDVNTGAMTTGWKRARSTATQFAVFWCGARFVLLAPSSPNFLVSLSTNGYTFTGDNTLAVLGTAITAETENIQFYRNGNNCYLNVGSRYRYSTDGGVTWAACTFAAAPNPTSYIMQYNTTDPAKLLIQAGLNSTIAYYTADSGATWSASRTLPTASFNGGLYYKGSTVVCANGNGGSVYKVSTDDGVTWVTPTFPIGTLGSNINFFADANRFYAGVYDQSQILTSSDAVTWTIVTLPQKFVITHYGTGYGYGIITYSGDSNTVVLLGANGASANQCLFSTDGGVTWTGSQYTVTNVADYWGVGNAFTTPDFGGIGFAFGMNGLTDGTNTNVFKSDITGGGAFYRTNATAITPLRTNALAFVRVG